MNSAALGKGMIIIGLVFFGALMFSLFLPFGGTVPPMIVSAMIVVALVFLVIGLFRGN